MSDPQGNGDDGPTPEEIERMREKILEEWLKDKENE